MAEKETPIQDGFERLAGMSSRAAGTFWAFLLALLTIVLWALTGPFFGYSETWQLVINTGTTIVTFLMVFLIQHAQNKDMRAVQFKLNELIAAVEGASNRLIDVEALSDHELEHLYARFQHLAKSAVMLSHGAKLTIDDDDDVVDSQARPPLRTQLSAPSNPAHVDSEAGKLPVRVKSESTKRNL